MIVVVGGVVATAAAAVRAIAMAVRAAAAAATVRTARSADGCGVRGAHARTAAADRSADVRLGRADGRRIDRRPIYARIAGTVSHLAERPTDEWIDGSIDRQLDRRHHM